MVFLFREQTRQSTGIAISKFKTLSLVPFKQPNKEKKSDLKTKKNDGKTKLMT
jgi:hypothetical protein